MHYCVYVFVPKQGDIEELVAQALEPYSDYRQVAAYRRYLDAGEIKAMAKHYSVKPIDLRALAEHLENWTGYPGGVEGKKLFVTTTSNSSGKWDWYEIGGRWHGHLRGNVMTSRTLLAKRNLDKLLPFAMVTPDGLWHERETYITKGWMNWHVESKSAAAWLSEVRKALRKSPDHRVVCVDIHG